MRNILQIIENINNLTGRNCTRFLNLKKMKINIEKMDPAKLETIEQITPFLIDCEAVISYFNNLYNFDIQKGTPGEIKLYNAVLKIWDRLKFRRNELKFKNFKNLQNENI